MQFAEPSGTTSHTNQADALTDESSVASSLEHLVSGTQGVINKRIDLALLEGRELLSRSVQGATLVGLGVVLAAAAWFALTASALLFVIPEASRIVLLATFGLLNGACAVGLVALAKQRGRPQTRLGANGNGADAPASTATIRRKE